MGSPPPGLTQTPYSYSRRPNTELDVVKDRVESWLFIDVASVGAAARPDVSCRSGSGVCFIKILPRSHYGRRLVSRLRWGRNRWLQSDGNIFTDTAAGVEVDDAVVIDLCRSAR